MTQTHLIETGTRRPLAAINLNGRTQLRVQGTVRERVEDYAALYASGHHLPPVTVFDDGKDLWLADGWHRVEAARLAGWTDIPCDVRTGKRTDAVLFALGANAGHGLRRSREDLHHAIRCALLDPELDLVRRTDRALAALVVCAPSTVGRVRAELVADEAIEDVRVRIDELGQEVHVRGGEEDGDQVPGQLTLAQATPLPFSECFRPESEDGSLGTVSFRGETITVELSPWKNQNGLMLGRIKVSDCDRRGSVWLAELCHWIASDPAQATHGMPVQVRCAVPSGGEVYAYDAATIAPYLEQLIGLDRDETEPIRTFFLSRAIVIQLEQRIGPSGCAEPVYLAWHKQYLDRIAARFAAVGEQEVMDAQGTTHRLLLEANDVLEQVTGTLLSGKGSARHRRLVKPLGGGDISRLLELTDQSILQHIVAEILEAQAARDYAAPEPSKPAEPGKGTDAERKEILQWLSEMADAIDEARPPSVGTMLMLACEWGVGEPTTMAGCVAASAKAKDVELFDFWAQIREVISTEFRNAANGAIHTLPSKDALRGFAKRIGIAPGKKDEPEEKPKRDAKPAKPAKAAKKPKGKK